MKRTLTITALLLAAIGCRPVPDATLEGRVTLDGRPVAGVLVSDGTQIVETNKNGKYFMISDKADSVVFITTPSGSVAVSEDGLRPGFWAALTEAPDKVERHDFKLVSENQERYNVLFFPDIHLSNDPRRNDIRRFQEKVAPYIREKASDMEGPVYLMNLGDLTHELYWYEFDFNESDAYNMLAELELPLKMYSVTGNHDHDGAIVGEDVDFRSAWIYRKVWGPDRYSVNIGNDHWVFLDNIIYVNEEGKGKKAPGIRGDRSYLESFTPKQLAWLEKDLSYVPDSCNVYICTHCPFFHGSNISEGRAALSEEQIAFIDSLCTRFEHKVLNFAGHIHKFDFFSKKEYPSFFQYGLPCASGVMWETPEEYSLYCSDGSEAGLMNGTCVAGIPMELSFETYDHGKRNYSIYDLNSVGKAYKNSAEVKIQRKKAPERADYSNRKFRNSIFVNWWTWYPGCTIEMFENGKALQVNAARHEDPVNNFTYDLPQLAHPVKHHAVRNNVSCIHMFEAKASKTDSPVEVIFKNEKGEELYRETIARPLPFIF